MTVRRVLITNDDGIDSPGLHALAGMAHDHGYQATVAAPDREASGTSSAISAHETQSKITIAEHPIPGLDGVPAYAVRATPALIALIACNGAFGDPPELVLSGINRGANVGFALIHSGTVGAALTAVTYGCPAMAVSLDVGLTEDRPYWSTAATVAAELLPAAIAAPQRVAINLNVPNRPLEQVTGLRPADLAAFGAVQMGLTHGSGYVQMTLKDDERAVEPGTDWALLGEGFATVTALQGVAEASGVDMQAIHLPALAR